MSLPILSVVARHLRRVPLLRRLAAEVLWPELAGGRFFPPPSVRDGAFPLPWRSPQGGALVLALRDGRASIRHVRDARRLYDIAEEFPVSRP